MKIIAISAAFLLGTVMLTSLVEQRRTILHTGGCYVLADDSAGIVTSSKCITHGEGCKN